MRLSGAVGARISDAVGLGTILNDDGLVIDDAVIVEGVLRHTNDRQREHSAADGIDDAGKRRTGRPPRVRRRALRISPPAAGQ